MSDVTYSGPDLYAQICHRIRVAMGEFNDDNVSIESLVSSLAEKSREHAAMQSVRPPVGVVSVDDVERAYFQCDGFVDRVGEGSADALNDAQWADMLKEVLESYASRHAPSKE